MMLVGSVGNNCFKFTGVVVVPKFNTTTKGLKLVVALIKNNKIFFLNKKNLQNALNCMSLPPINENIIANHNWFVGSISHGNRVSGFN